MRDVQIGDRRIDIPKFSGYKVVRGGQIVKAVTEKYPAIMRDAARFEREFEKENVSRITRAMLALPRFHDLREELDEEAFGDRDYIEFPESPSEVQIVASVFPQIMDVAKDEIATLIALVLAPNSELEEKDDDGEIDVYLKAEGRKWLFRADADQILDVAIVAWEVLLEQFAQKMGGDSGNLLALFRTEVDAARSKETSNGNSPGSSTDSPAPTVGIADESSTGPHGESSAP